MESELNWAKVSQCDTSACLEFVWVAANSCESSACAEAAHAGKDILLRSNLNPEVVLRVSNEQWLFFLKFLKKEDPAGLVS